VLSALDLAVLWGDLGIGLLVLVTGALLVPALGFGIALLAIVVGSVAGVALLSLVAMAGADHGVPTMVLFRPLLGVRGSWFPSVLNALQLIGWTAVELWAMSAIADLVCQRVFGFSTRWLWLLVAASISTWFALWGPVGVTRVWMERFGAWVIVGICAAVTVFVAVDAGFASLTAPGRGGWPTFGAALDLVIAMPVSWLPLVADYTRFARGAGSAFAGTFSGYLIANVWLYALGAGLVLATDTRPDPAGVAAGILALMGGSIAGFLFLVGLLAGETDEAFADIYSASVCLQNIFPKPSQRSLAVAVAVVSTVLAAWLTMQRYEAFLFLIGSVFVPLFGILAAEYFFKRRRAIDVAELYRDEGRYWFTGGVRIAAFVPWVAGFALYHWIAPTGPGWWVRAIDGVFGAPLSERFAWMPASVPSFLAAFLLALAVAPERMGNSARVSSADRGKVGD
jgi:putative hydroxymethylpyrimidine transporter CytX